MNMIDCATKLTDLLCSNLVKGGITHVGRYLPTSDWKALSIGEVQSIQNAGLNLISVFENGGTKSNYFTKDQGVQDAYQAYSLAQSIKQPEGTAIYFTVDFDAQTNDFAGILNYFQGLKNTLTSYKIGVYGKFDVIQLVQSKGLANYFWQTYAWSSGQHASGIHLFQYKNDITQYGLNLDLDQVENPDCGAWKVFVSNSNVLQVLKCLYPTDIRRKPDHNSDYVRDAQVGEIFNVFAKQNVNGQSWNLIGGDPVSGEFWVDDNGGSNFFWVDNPNLKKTSTTTTYKIQSGDTLTSLALRYKLTVNDLLKLNPQISNPNKINVGQSLNVPR